MGLDLWIAIGFIAAISGLAYLAGRRLSLTVYRHRPLLFAESLVFSLIFAFGVSNQLGWANAFPTAAAVCWSNWIPIFLAFAAGLAVQISSLRPSLRRTVSVSMMLLACAFLVTPVVRPKLFPIQIDPVAKWDDGVCLQSHEASCGPAAAATLLHQVDLLNSARLAANHGNWSSVSTRSAEQLMADACLTSSHGTLTLGLVRGLRIAVSQTPRSVEVAETDPALWASRNQLPNVSIVRFEQNQSAGPVRTLLGSGGEGHAVVVDSVTSDGRWRVADPAVGWRLWDDDEFRQVFTGEAIYLTSLKTESIKTAK